MPELDTRIKQLDVLPLTKYYMEQLNLYEQDRTAGQDTHHSGQQDRTPTTRNPVEAGQEAGQDTHHSKPS